MRIEIQWNSLFPLSMPYVTTLQYREIFWQNGSLLYGSDTAKQEFFMRLQLRLQSLHKHDFISNQLLFYCWLTQQHFNFSVSFSFNTFLCLNRIQQFFPNVSNKPFGDWQHHISKFLMLELHSYEMAQGVLIYRDRHNQELEHQLQIQTNRHYYTDVCIQ